MANEAEVYVKNVFTGSETINVKRLEQDKSVSLDVDVIKGASEQVQLSSPDVQLVVTAPEGKDTRDCLMRVTSDVDLDVINSRTDSTWTFQIIPNSLPPDQPTTVNVTIGQDEPD